MVNENLGEVKRFVLLHCTNFSDALLIFEQVSDNIVDISVEILELGSVNYSEWLSVSNTKRARLPRMFKERYL